VAEVRGRGATLLAAGAVIASLLAKPVFDGEHPHGFAEIAATGVGLLGSTGILVFVVLLLRWCPWCLRRLVSTALRLPREHGFSASRQSADAPQAEQRPGTWLGAEAAPDDLQSGEEGRLSEQRPAGASRAPVGRLARRPVDGSPDQCAQEVTHS